MLKSVFVQGNPQEEYRNQFYHHVGSNIGKGNLRDWTSRFRFLAQKIQPPMSEVDLIYHYSRSMRQGTRVQLANKSSELRDLVAVCQEADRYETAMSGLSESSHPPNPYGRYRYQRAQSGADDMDMSALNMEGDGDGRGNGGGGGRGNGRGGGAGRGRGVGGGRGRGGEERPPKTGRQPMPWAKPEDIAQRREKGTCLSCGSESHMLKECPKVIEYNKKQASGNGNRPQQGASQA